MARETEEDEIDWGSDDNEMPNNAQFVSKERSILNVANHITPHYRNKEIQLYPRKLLIHLQCGHYLTLIRNKENTSWQTKLLHEWPYISIYPCLNSLSIEVQCRGDSSSILLKKDGAVWLGYPPLSSGNIEVYQRDIEELVKGCRIIIKV
jgi:hypothetical protein